MEYTQGLLPGFDIIEIARGSIFGPLPDRSPLVVSYGMGTDSTALLIGLHQMGVRPEAILFADVGNEFDHTYNYLEVISDWLKQVDFPAITEVRYQPKRFKWHRYQTLAGNCLANRTLPSLAFGYKSCSLKWKGTPLDKAVTELFGDQACYRAIGYDCSPKDNKRFAHAKGKKNKNRPQDKFIYPLQIWGWSRAKCKAVISGVGLPDPGKSSCYFCPSIKQNEVKGLPVSQLCKIVIIEANASVNLKTVKGLWRQEGKITDYIISEGLLPGEVIDYLWNRWSGERIVTDPETLADQVLDDEVDYIMSNFGDLIHRYQEITLFE